nr:sphingosine kinase 2 [Chelonoidis abingdonii]
MNLVLGPYGKGAETLLHGEFGAYPSKGSRYALSLTRTALHIQRLVPKPETDQRTVVPLAEVVGCHTLHNRTSADRAAYFSVYAYPLKKRKVAVGSGRGRQRAARTFQVDGADDYEKNQAVAEKWATAIKCLVLGIPISSDTDITPSLLPRPPRLLLLLNPFGGRGLALQWCQTHVLPMITEADISFNLIQTERPNHARELVKGINVAEWDGIVAISGDGLLYEVLNGLMERPDWEQAIKMPVGILPSGSGNALAGAINCNAGLEQVLGLELLLNCAMLLCHAAVTPLDLVAVTTASGARCFSCLSVAWGFVSDVDIESEKYRHMGAARFTLGPGELPAGGMGEARVGGPPDELLVPLGQPVPGSWVTVEDNFVLVLAIYQSHLGADLFAAPFARFDDGLIHLCFIKAGISRAALVRLFLAMEKGNHFEQECPHLVHVPVRAFRLEPLTRKGILTVDGERVEYGPIQGQVHRGLARLITGGDRLKIATG